MLGPTAGPLSLERQQREILGWMRNGEHNGSKILAAGFKG